MEESKICQICEINKPLLLCNTCTNSKYLCKECYTSSHKASHKKMHNVQSLSNLSKKYTSYDEVIAEIAIPSCNKHKTRLIHFVCKKCDFKALCCDCLLEENHKGHEILEAQDAKIEIKKKAEENLEVMKNVATKITEKIKENETFVEKLEGNVKKQLESLDENFVKIEVELKKKKEILKNELIGKMNSDLNLLIKNKEELQNFTNSISNNISEIQKAILEENTIIMCDEKFLAKNIQSNFDKFNNNNNEQFAIKDQVKIEILNMQKVMQNISEMYLNVGIKEKIIPIQDNEIKCDTEKLYKCKGLVETKKKIRQFATLCYDSITKKWYETSFHVGPATLVCYNSLKDVFSEKPISTINLKSSIGSSYCIAKNGYIYYGKYQAMQIVKMNVNTGEIVSTMKINSNFEVFVWVCSDILLMKDESNEKFYVVYKIDHESLSVSEFICEPEMRLGTTYLIHQQAYENISICKIFIYNSRVFIAKNSDSKLTQFIYNLEKEKLEDQFTIMLPYENNLSFVLYLPQENAFITNHGFNSLTYFECKY